MELKGHTKMKQLFLKKQYKKVLYLEGKGYSLQDLERHYKVKIN